MRELLHGPSGRFERHESGAMWQGLAVFSDNKGYNCVWMDGRSQKVHILTWEAANGPKPAGHDIHHRDENKANYDLENLELLSHSDHQKVHAGWRRDGLGQWVAKPCTACLKVLPLADFYPRKGLTPSARCRTCHCAATSEWAEKNREKRREIARNWWHRNKSTARSTNAET